MSKIVKKKIGEICDVANSNKSITYAMAKEHEGIYPVYAATINKPFAYVDFYNNDKKCLAVVNDGASGCTYIIADEKYTIGKHITGLIPHENIDINYLQLVAEPRFRFIAKGDGRGNLPKVDILEVEVEIPVKDDETYDLEEQQRLAGIYSEIENQKQKLLSRIYDIQELLIHIDKEDGVQYKDVALNDTFDFRRGEVISAAHINSHKGEYPVYSTQEGVYGYIDTYMEAGKHLLWNTDGLAGFIKVVEGNFSYTNIVGILLPKKETDVANLYLEYLKYYLEPIFRKNKKGRMGIYGKNEHTKLNSTMIKDLNIQIPIPIKPDGSYDLEKQKEIADRYKQVDEIKQGLIDKINYLTSISVVPEITKE